MPRNLLKLELVQNKERSWSIVWGHIRVLVLGFSDLRSLLTWFCLKSCRCACPKDIDPYLTKNWRVKSVWQREEEGEREERKRETGKGRFGGVRSSDITLVNIKWRVSRSVLFNTLWPRALELLCGILQARILERECPFPPPRDLPDPGIEPGSLTLQWILYLLSHQGSLTLQHWEAMLGVYTEPSLAEKGYQKIFREKWE